MNLQAKQKKHLKGVATGKQFFFSSFTTWVEIYTKMWVEIYTMVSHISSIIILKDVPDTALISDEWDKQTEEDLPLIGSSQPVVQRNTVLDQLTSGSVSIRRQLRDVVNDSKPSC